MERLRFEVERDTGELDEVWLTTEQVLTLGALGDVIEIEKWSLCVNGCCIVARERGFDEHAWFIREDGYLEKLDRYGNLIVEVPVE